MPKILVKKSNPLKGSVKIDGAKNAVLPIIAATLLAKGKSTLNGVPNLKDVHVISDLLRHLGAEVEYNNNTLTVDATNITIKITIQIIIIQTNLVKEKINKI